MGLSIAKPDSNQAPAISAVNTRISITTSISTNRVALFVLLLLPITLSKIYIRSSIIASQLVGPAAELARKMSTSSTPSKSPVYFISHGGPNIIYEKDHPAYKALQKIGKEITQQVKPTRGVVVFSAHWQAGRGEVKVNIGEGSGLIYDFYGFPDHYYKETFPHRGSKQLAAKVLDLFKEAGIHAEAENRDLDHGVWAGFKCMFDPKENALTVPIVQVSLFDNEDPDMHYALGQAVSKLRSEGVVIICSGMAVHNLRDMRYTMVNSKTMDYVEPFDKALKEAVTAASGDKRKKNLADLLKIPVARKAHPEFEHLLPIHIAAGAAEGDKATQLFTRCELSLSWAQYRFGEPPALA